MAVQRGLTNAIGDALLSFFEWAAPRTTDRMNHWARTVADTVRPDPAMRIVTSDGLVLTGLLVVDAGEVILFIGTRSPPANAPAAPRPGPPGSPPRVDGAIPLWGRDLDPRDFDDGYRRR